MTQPQPRVTFDYTNFLASAVGPEHGLTDKDLADAAPLAEKAFAAVSAARGKGWQGWTELHKSSAYAEECVALWKKCEGRFDNLVVIGIGGSSLGTLAVKSALCHPLHNELPDDARRGARLYMLDNPDPVVCAAVLETLDLERTLFNVISKSGTTAETTGQFLVAREAVIEEVGEKHWAGHFVLTTDPRKGDMRKLAEKEKIPALAVPDGVGGRFSVLSPVGLFPAAAMGLDVGELLAGAAEVDARCSSPDWRQNPALALAVCLWLLDSRKEKPMHVLMPYASGLADLADWYRQLWAESLGKARSLDGRTVNVGPTPIKALGAVDQHSQVQLYAEGPYDKAFVFVGLRKFAREVTMPKAYEDMSAFGYLGGHGLGELLDAERQGTEVALTAAGRPNATIFIDDIGERTLGGIFFLLEMATAYAGRLYNVDAFDQPGVEAGKVASYALLGRKGFEDERAKIEKSRPAGGRKTV